MMVRSLAIYDQTQHGRETGFKLQGGVLTTIYFPGAQGGTHVGGVGQGGLITGYYYDNQSLSTTGFVAKRTP